MQFFLGKILGIVIVGTLSQLMKYLVAFYLDPTIPVGVGGNTIDNRQ